MKAQSGVAADSSLMHTLHITAGNELYVTQASKLLYGQAQLFMATQNIEA